MKEIKFRAWSKKTNQMMMEVQNMYDGLGDWFDNKGNEIDPYAGFNTDSFGGVLEDKGCIVMQYTGLKDKNGREIYEGDIMKINNDNYDPDYECFFVGICIVFWKDIGFSFRVIRNDMKSPHALDSTGMWLVGEGDTTEVIGNIYENPELLK